MYIYIHVYVYVYNPNSNLVSARQAVLALRRMSSRGWKDYSFMKNTMKKFIMICIYMHIYNVNGIM